MYTHVLNPSACHRKKLYCTVLVIIIFKLCRIYFRRKNRNYGSYFLTDKLLLFRNNLLSKHIPKLQSIYLMGKAPLSEAGILLKLYVL